tara:strand:- start:1205 stop:1315 length:111 start_codon:yes stop_codon:yes gene_type:complete
MKREKSRLKKVKKQRLMKSLMNSKPKDKVKETTDET